MTASQIADLVAHQIERETKMVLDGRDRAARKDQTAARAGEQTRAERLTLEHLVPTVRDFLKDVLASYEGTPGRRPIWFPVLQGLDLNEVAAAALRAAFTSAMRGTERTKALILAGRLLEVSYLHSGLREQAQTRVQREKVKNLIKGKTSQAARARAIAAKAQAEPWDTEKLVQAGAPLLSAAIATGLFETRQLRRGDDVLEILCLSDLGTQMVREVEELGLMARPIYRAMLTKPRDWEALDTGAYVTDAVRSGIKLVRTSEKAHLGLLQRGVKDGSLQPVMGAVSAVQGVPMAINPAVLALREWVSKENIPVPGVTPLKDTVDVPDVAEDCKDRKQWAQRARALRVNAGIGPNLLSWKSVTDEAKSLCNDEGNRFFLPHTVDFRGRVYPVSFVNHHAGDATKALLQFAEGKELGEEGLFWLKVHVANCGDFDKISKRPFWERVKWVDDNLADLIFNTAYGWMDDRRWMEADAPFSFYAACVDLMKALASGNPATYVSHIPVALDGSNSGVQHYSALMRAEEGRFVNLTPEEAPQDLYKQVADVVAARVQKAKRMAARVLERAGQPYPDRETIIGHLDSINAELEALEAPFKTAELRPDAPTSRMILRLKARRSLANALLWAEEGVGRSTVKRSVMTFGYSSVAFGMGQQIRDDYMEPLSLRVLRGELPAHPFGADEGRSSALWLGRAVYHSVVRVLPRVAAAMKWLKEVAGILAHEGKGVLLVTPMGFPMLMRETDWQGDRVELLLLDRTVPVREATSRDRVVGGSVLRRVRVTLRTGDGPTILKNKQQSGVAPNVIHAMDACHLQMVVLRLRELGVEDLLVIHDSFATHAANVGLMSVVLREQLVALYADFDPLEDIRDRALKVLSAAGAAKLPPLPERGTLDLDAVLEATYSFA